jgi:hypothetical protein
MGYLILSGACLVTRSDERMANYKALEQAVKRLDDTKCPANLGKCLQALV